MNNLTMFCLSMEPKHLNTINELGVKHLLVDIPSIDKANDGGRLGNHRSFFRQGATISELLYIPDNILGNAGLDYEVTGEGEVTAVNFRLSLKRGSTKLSAWFVNGRDDGDIAGVYYAYITKL